MLRIDNDWGKVLEREFEKSYFKDLEARIEEEYQEHLIFPPREDLFQAFEITPFQEVKIVILGQDPYHDDGQAHGLSFSVQPGVKIPPSLVNIYKELADDLACEIPESGYLKSWAQQGVLLLNTVLTVRAHEANSHQKIGWEKFTDAVIECLNKEDRPIVFILWGKPAQKKAKMLNNPKHLLLEAPHPSPLSCYRGFYGCKHFSKANEFLIKNELVPINWYTEKD